MKTILKTALIFSIPLISGRNCLAQFQIGTDIDGRAPGSRSGYSLSVFYASQLVIGAPTDNTVTIFDTYNWLKNSSKLQGEKTGDHFGWSVWTTRFPSNDPFIVVGAPQNDGVGTNAGHVRLFRSQWAGTNTSFNQFGSDIDGVHAGDGFGFSIDAEFDFNAQNIGWLAVGAPGSNNGTGSVRVFRPQGPGGSMVQAGSTLQGQARGDSFGYKVIIRGETLMIGSPYHDGSGNDAGRVAVFEWNSKTSDWKPKGTTLDGQAADDQFGKNMDAKWIFSPQLNQVVSVLCIGAPGAASGKGQVSSHYWSESQNKWLTAFPALYGDNPGDAFGHALEMSYRSSPRMLVVGAPGHDGNGNNSGLVRV